ncbi:hypothetical protein ACRAWF_32960 [Streptomyces sp. L7]
MESVIFLAAAVTLAGSVTSHAKSPTRSAYAVSGAGVLGRRQVDQGHMAPRIAVQQPGRHREAEAAGPTGDDGRGHGDSP